MLGRKELGQRGEQVAAEHLARQGYRILARNHRTPLGELDLVARDGLEIVFVEVKSRMDAAAHPEEAVDAVKVARLGRLAEAYLSAKGWEEVMWRIDVVAVVLDEKGRLRRLEHLRNAVY